MLRKFPPSLSAKAPRSLQSLGETVRLGHTVSDLDDESVTLGAADGLTVHLFYLIGFENRLLVLMIRWAFSFATHGRGARLIAGEAGAPKPAPTGARTGARHSGR